MGEFFEFVALDHVVFFVVAEAGELDAALHAVADFVDLILEAAQRFEAAVIHGLAVAQHAGALLALHGAIGDDGTADEAFVDLEDLLHASVAEHLLAGERIQQALHGFFDLVDEFVDDGVELHLHAFAFRGDERLVLYLDVEADDDGVGSAGEQHVGFVDGADFLVQEVEVALVGLDVGETFGDSFDGALHVALEDDLEGFLVAVFDAGKKMLQRGTTRHIELLLAQFFEALLAESFDIAFAAHDDDFIANVRHVAEADDFTRHAGQDFLDGFTTVVDQRFDLAPMRAADEGLAGSERTLADDDSGNGAFAGDHG